MAKAHGWIRNNYITNTPSSRRFVYTVYAENERKAFISRPW